MEFKIGDIICYCGSRWGVVTKVHPLLGKQALVFQTLEGENVTTFSPSCYLLEESIKTLESRVQYKKEKMKELLRLRSELKLT